MIRNVPNEDIVNAYDVTYTELKPGWEQYPDDWDLYLFERRTFSFATLTDLEVALRSEWGRELQEFRLPGDVDHPF